MVMGELDIGTMTVTLLHKEGIVGVMVQDVELGLNGSLGSWSRKTIRY